MSSIPKTLPPLGPANNSSSLGKSQSASCLAGHPVTGLLPKNSGNTPEKEKFFVQELKSSQSSHFPSPSLGLTLKKPLGPIISVDKEKKSNLSLSAL